MYQCTVVAYTCASLSSFLVLVCKVDQEIETPSKGLRDRAQSRLYGAAYKGKSLDGVSETEAQAGFLYAIEYPHTASQALRTSSNYHSSTQESYSLVEAAVDLSKIAKSDKKRQKRGEDN